MSIVPPPAAPTDVVDSKPSKPRELAVFHHSSLFYWWPVWLLGFILAGITAYEDHYLAIVPHGTTAVEEQTVHGGRQERGTCRAGPAAGHADISRTRTKRAK